MYIFTYFYTLKSASQPPSLHNLHLTSQCLYSNCFGPLMKTMVQFVVCDLEGLGPVQVYCLVKPSVSVNPKGLRLVESVELYVEFLSPPGPPILPPTLQKMP